MNIKDLLPIGSVVLLKNGAKKLMIIGIKQTDVASEKEYDYLSVMYPEGYIGNSMLFFFNHESIDEVIFKGHDSEERTALLEKLEDFYSNND